MHLALAFAAVLAATPPQQSPNIPSLGETLEISIVNVDVVVTDRDGNRVRGLAREDFEIYDGGVRQRISNFAEYASGDAAVNAPRRDGETSTTPPQKRTVLVFLERMRLPTFEAEPFIGAIRRSLRTMVRPGDSAALVFWSRGAAVRIDGLDAVDAMLGGIARDFVGAEVDDVQIARQLADEASQFQQDAADFAARQGLRLQTADDDGSDGALEILRMRAWREMVARIAAIDAAISSMAGQEGKKILLLAPRTLGELVIPPATNDRVDPWIKSKYGTDKLIKPVLENANASGVTIYTLFAPRIQTGLPDASMRESQNPIAGQLRVLNEAVSLHGIAEKTGGLFALSVTDAVKLLPRIEEDVTDYYSLAFRGDGKPGDRVRNIVVKTRKPDYLVRSRRQYVEKSDVSRMKDRVAAALTIMPDDSFDITANVGAVVRSRGRETVPVSIRIPIHALTVVPGARNAGQFAVFVAAGSPDGSFSDVTMKTQPFELRDVESARQGHFTYTIDVVVEKKMDRIAVGVLDQVSKEYALLRLPIAR